MSIFGLEEDKKDAPLDENPGRVSTQNSKAIGITVLLVIGLGIGGSLLGKFQAYLERGKKNSYFSQDSRTLDTSKVSKPSLDFVKVSLPLNGSVEVPTEWYRAEQNGRVIGKVSETSLDMAAVSLTSANQNIFWAKSAPRMPFATTEVAGQKSQGNSDEIMTSSTADLEKILNYAIDGLKQQYSTNANVQKSQWERIGSHPAYRIQLNVPGSQGQKIIVRVTRVFVGLSMFTFAHAYPESESNDWRPVIDYIDNSIQFGE